MVPVKVGARLYHAGTVVKAFDFFVTSRALYSNLRSEFQLPSIRNLTLITSSISKQEDTGEPATTRHISSRTFYYTLNKLL